MGKDVYQHRRHNKKSAACASYICHEIQKASAYRGLPQRCYAVYIRDMQQISLVYKKDGDGQGSYSYSSPV